MSVMVCDFAGATSTLTIGSGGGTALSLLHPEQNTIRADATIVAMQNEKTRGRTRSAPEPVRAASPRHPASFARCIKTLLSASAALPERLDNEPLPYPMHFSRK